MMVNILRQLGDFDGALAAGQQALELAAALGEISVQMRASYRLSQVYTAVGDFGHAAELLRRSVEAADQGADRSSTEVRIQGRTWLAYTLGELGTFAEARRHGEEALRLATWAGQGGSLIMAHNRLGNLYRTQGDLEPAILVLEQGLTLCRASGNRNMLRPIVTALGSAYALQGRLTEGRALLKEGLDENLRAGARPSSQSLAWLSEACHLAGRCEEAWQYARQALDLARQGKARGGEAYALHQLGVVQAHADPPDVVQAEAHYRQALALAEELGMRPLVAHCHLGLGQLYGKTGRAEQARTALSTAIEIYHAMEMTFWLPQAEAALAQVE
jgi:tetratricopeptide (TPR) repeat protein